MPNTLNLGYLNELAQVYEECKNPNWDGYRALPVEQDTLRLAHRVIESLPFGFFRPSIGAEPDGQITLEWRNGSTRILSVSVDPDGWLHYAGLIDSRKVSGKIEVSEFSISLEKIIPLVREIYQ